MVGTENYKILKINMRKKKEFECKVCNNGKVYKTKKGYQIHLGSIRHRYHRYSKFYFIWSNTRID